MKASSVWGALVDTAAWVPLLAAALHTLWTVLILSQHDGVPLASVAVFALVLAFGLSWGALVRILIAHGGRPRRTYGTERLLLFVVGGLAIVVDAGLGLLHLSGNGRIFALLRFGLSMGTFLAANVYSRRWVAERDAASAARERALAELHAAPSPSLGAGLYVLFDPRELSEFVLSFPEGHEILSELPAEWTPPRARAEDAAVLFSERGVVGATLRKKLVSARPDHEPLISRIPDPVPAESAGA